MNQQIDRKLHRNKMQILNNANLSATDFFFNAKSHRALVPFPVDAI